MGQQVFEPAQSWELGAHSTPAQDLGPKGSFSLGENTVLLNNTGESAIIAQREGWALQNSDPQLGAPKIIGLYDYIRSLTNLTLASIHLVVGSNGRLDKLLPDQTLGPADAAQPIPFTSGVYPPSFATTHNRCFIANGIDPLQAFNGTKCFDVGIAAPAAPVISNAGVGVLPAGTYSVLITYFDQTTGAESSASPISNLLTLAANSHIRVNWTLYAGEHPTTHTRVYLRWENKQTEHFLVPDIDATHLGMVPVPDTTTLINLTQDQLDGMTLLAPDEFENNPPPVGLVGIESHVSRLFGHDGSKVYYSQLGKPEAWDPDNFFLVNTDDGQKIIALHAAHEVLIVFKRDSVWALYGEDPATWTPRMISPSVGCVNERSIMYIEGNTYWWSESGPMMWGGAGPVENIARGRIDDVVAFDKSIVTAAASPSATHETVGIIGVADILNQRLLWAVPTVGSIQNNVILPYKYKFNQWEATKWFGIDASALAAVQDDSSTPYVYLGGYKGQIFRYGGVFNDGTPPGTPILITNPSPPPATIDSGRIHGLVEGTSTQFTKDSLVIDTAKGDLLTEGGGLSERYVFINTPDRIERWQIKRIGSNTADTITLAPGEEFNPIPGPGSVWTWSVGTIAFRVQLPWQTFSAPFIRKRLEYGYFWVGSTVGGADIEAGLFRNYNNDDLVRLFLLPLGAVGLIWDVGNWDEETWGAGIAANRYRRRLAKTCFVYRWAFRQYSPNVDVLLYKVDTRGETQVDKG